MSRREPGQRKSLPLPFPSPCHRAAILLLAILLAFFLPRPATAITTGTMPTVLRVGISSQVFPDLDHNDVRIAMSLWTREVARKVGVECQPLPVIFNNAHDLLLSVKRGELTLASLSALEYLQIRDRAPMTPLIVASHNNGKGRRFVLLTHRASGIRSLADLHDKRIILPQTKNQAAHLWLDVMLLREGEQDRSSFFQRVEEGVKPSQAILALFFRRVDAVIVSRDAFETGKILNPQTGKKLAVIAESDYLLDGVTCIPHRVNATLRASIERAALSLHEDTVGKQILTLFQMQRTTLFSPSQLSGVEALVRERNRLLAHGRRKR